MASGGARAKMSAHETTPGQISSSLVLMSSISLCPLTEFAFGNAVFSRIVQLSSNNMEPSQPYVHMYRDLY